MLKDSGIQCRIKWVLLTLQHWAHSRNWHTAADEKTIKKSSLLSLSGKGVTVLGKLFTPIVPLFTKQRNWYRPMGREGNCGPGGK